MQSLCASVPYVEHSQSLQSMQAKHPTPCNANLLHPNIYQGSNSHGVAHSAPVAQFLRGSSLIIPTPWGVNLRHTIRNKYCSDCCTVECSWVGAKHATICHLRHFHLVLQQCLSTKVDRFCGSHEETICIFGADVQQGKASQPHDAPVWRKVLHIDGIVACLQFKIIHETSLKKITGLLCIQWVGKASRYYRRELSLWSWICTPLRLYTVECSSPWQAQGDGVYGVKLTPQCLRNDAACIPSSQQQRPRMLDHYVLLLNCKI